VTREKEPLIHAAFGAQIFADQRNNVSANQWFLLLCQGRLSQIGASSKSN